MKKTIYIFLCFFFYYKSDGLQYYTIDKKDIKVITNGEYIKFINWVRDSIAHKILNSEQINWKEKISWNGELEKNILEEMYFPEHERFYREKQLDTRKFNFAFKNSVINIYPDTLSWIDTLKTDYLGENIVEYYNWHPFFYDYPVQGLTEEQAAAFIFWKNNIEPKNKKTEIKYKLASSDDLINTANYNLNFIVSTEFWKITNKKYKEYVCWVRDSIAHRVLGDAGKTNYLIVKDKYGKNLHPPLINWKKKLIGMTRKQKIF